MTNTATTQDPTEDKEDEKEEETTYGKLIVQFIERAHAVVSKASAGHAVTITMETRERPASTHPIAVKGSIERRQHRYGMKLTGHSNWDFTFAKN